MPGQDERSLIVAAADGAQHDSGVPEIRAGEPADRLAGPAGSQPLPAVRVRAAQPCPGRQLSRHADLLPGYREQPRVLARHQGNLVAGPALQCRQQGPYVRPGREHRPLTQPGRQQDPFCQACRAAQEDSGTAPQPVTGTPLQDLPHFTLGRRHHRRRYLAC